jgi:UDP:flavonoid glycosyltransferase YjiC (YdhE family)
MKLLLAVPPFYSHFRPMFSIARAASVQGAEVIIAGSEAFRAEVEEAGLGFHRLEINKNANVPAGSDTGLTQAAREQERLKEFIDATYRGPVETLITLGTFLSRRHDVLEKTARMIKKIAPDFRILMGGGTDNPAGLKELRKRLTGIAEVHAFLPQEALLSTCELVVHHGVPVIVMPFSSDQFSVAGDVERHGLGAVLDPNALNPYNMRIAFEICRRWSRIIRKTGGPHAAAARLLNREELDFNTEERNK